MRSFTDRVPLFIASRLPAGWIQAVVAFLVAAALVSIGFFASRVTLLPLELLIPALGAGCGMMLLAMLNERLWIFLALPLHLSLMTLGKDSGLGPGEVLFMIGVLGGIAVWFMKELMIHRRTILVTGFDTALLTFLVIMTVNAVIATAIWNGDPLQFLKEWGTTAGLFYYFPLRTALQSDRDVRILLVVMSLIMFLNGVVVIATYRERIAEAVYVWQTRTNRANINEITSGTMVILNAIWLAYARNWRWRLIALGGASFGAVCLVLSYSRGPIAACIGGLAVASLFLPLRRTLRMVTALVLAVLLGGAAFFVAFPSVANNVASGLGARLLTLGQVRQDRSLNARVVESQTLLTKYIPSSPIIGYGFGPAFTFITPLTNTTLQTTFIHNGVLWALYKFGIPMTIVLFALIIAPMVGGVVRLRPRDDLFSRPMAAGVIGSFVMALIMNMTSMIFLTSGILTLVVGWALFDYNTRRSLTEHNSAITGPEP